MPAILETCEQNSVGMTTQSDNCPPGAGCIKAECPSPRCYQFCRSAADCSNKASCTRDAGGGNAFCDVPQVSCDPVKGNSNGILSGCGTSTVINCYLSADMSHTLCDCQFTRAAGSGAAGDPCTRSRDCFGGLACYDATGGGTKTCFQVCRLLGAPDSGVPAGAMEGTCPAGVCFPFLGGGTTYGYCNR
jgi:hypothetical protein